MFSLGCVYWVSLIIWLGTCWNLTEWDGMEWNGWFGVGGLEWFGLEWSLWMCDMRYGMCGGYGGYYDMRI